MERHELEKIRDTWGLYSFPIYQGPFVVCSNKQPNNMFVSKHGQNSFAKSPAIVSKMQLSEIKNFHSIMAPFISEQNAVIIPHRSEEQPLNSIRKQTRINTNAIEGMIISEFTKLDITSAQSIASFCNKYGLPFANPVLNRFVCLQEIANSQTYGMFVDDFNQYVVFMKQLVKLTFIVTSKPGLDVKSALETIIFLLFTADYRRSEHEVIKSFPTTWLAEIKNTFDDYCRDICSMCEIDSVPKNMMSQINSNRKLLVDYSERLIKLHEKSNATRQRGKRAASSQATDAVVFETSIEVVKLISEILGDKSKNRGVEVLFANRYGEISLSGTIDCSNDLKNQVVIFAKKLLCEILNVNLKQTHIAVAFEASDNGGESIKGVMSVKSLSDIMFTELYFLLTVPDILARCDRCKQLFVKINKRSHAVYCCKRCKDAAMQYYKRHPDKDYRHKREPCNDK